MFIGLAWGQDCTADDGTDGVELWGVCYSIENTDTLVLGNLGLGTIPAEIGNLVNLTYLGLFNNQLTGSIPSEIGNLVNLSYIHLSYNQFTGSMPSEIGNLINLAYLGLFNNQLTGSIPPEIGNQTNLIYLNLTDNDLTDSIPPGIGDLTNLLYLRLSNNSITGSIPESIWGLTNLNYLMLNNNQLTGTISSEIGNLTSLSWLWLNDNQITGLIPSEIGNLTNLTELILYNNQLSGEIPDDICNLDGYLDLSFNELCPPYPECLSESSIGEQDTTSCSQVSIDENITPLSFNLHQNYPNPFNPITTLRYDLPEDSFVEITVYDMLGNVVNNLINQNQNSGYKSIQWNATNNVGQPVSAGLYLYMIQAGDFRKTKKMVLLK